MKLNPFTDLISTLGEMAGILKSPFDLPETKRKAVALWFNNLYILVPSGAERLPDWRDGNRAAQEGNQFNLL